MVQKLFRQLILVNLNIKTMTTWTLKKYVLHDDMMNLWVVLYLKFVLRNMSLSKILLLPPLVNIDKDK